MIDDALRVRVAAAVVAAGGDADLLTLEPPRDPRHGDLSTSIALQLAKTLRQKPLELQPPQPGSRRQKGWVRQQWSAWQK